MGQNAYELVSTDAIWWDLNVGTYQSRVSLGAAAASILTVPELALAVEGEAVKAIAFSISASFWPDGV